MTPSHITRAASYFPVDDVAAIGAWYRDVLGFSCEYTAGEPVEFAQYSRGGCVVMFRRVADAARVTPNEAQGGTWDLFCWVGDVEQLFAELSSRGATMVYPPAVQPYGMKEFAVRDPNGYVLGFGQTWPDSARRT